MNLDTGLCIYLSVTHLTHTPLFRISLKRWVLLLLCAHRTLGMWVIACSIPISDRFSNGCRESDIGSLCARSSDQETINSPLHTTLCAPCPALCYAKFTSSGFSTRRLHSYNHQGNPARDYLVYHALVFVFTSIQARYVISLLGISTTMGSNHFNILSILTPQESSALYISSTFLSVASIFLLSSKLQFSFQRVLLQAHLSSLPCCKCIGKTHTTHRSIENRQPDFSSPLSNISACIPLAF